jgi:hypothetical protein
VVSDPSHAFLAILCYDLLYFMFVQCCRVPVRFRSGLQRFANLCGKRILKSRASEAAGAGPRTHLSGQSDLSRCLPSIAHPNPCRHRDKIRVKACHFSCTTSTTSTRAHPTWHQFRYSRPQYSTTQYTQLHEALAMTTHVEGTHTLEDTEVAS